MVFITQKHRKELGEEKWVLCIRDRQSLEDNPPSHFSLFPIEKNSQLFCPSPTILEVSKIFPFHTELGTSEVVWKLLSHQTGRTTHVLGVWRKSQEKRRQQRQGAPVDCLDDHVRTCEFQSLFRWETKVQVVFLAHHYTRTKDHERGPRLERPYGEQICWKSGSEGGVREAETAWSSATSPMSERWSCDTLQIKTGVPTREPILGSLSHRLLYPEKYWLKERGNVPARGNLCCSRKPMSPPFSYILSLLDTGLREERWRAGKWRKPTKAHLTILVCPEEGGAFWIGERDF